MSKSRESSTNILNIWDSEQPCFINNGQVLLWRQFVTPNSLPNVVSICEIVEERATEIRSQLLKYIYDVGESINNNSKTQLRLKQDFNYFWMTQFHSRPYTESGQLNNLAKVFALIQIINENKFEQITFHSSNQQLTKVIRNLSTNLNLEFKSNLILQSKSQVTTKSQIKLRTPKPLLALFALVAQLKVSINLQANKSHVNSDASISFFDYWYRFGSSVQENRKFESQYWTNLVGDLEETQANWLHNLVDQRGKTALSEANSLLKDFNQNSTKHHHSIADSQMNFKIFWSSLKDYGKLFTRTMPISKYKSAFSIEGTDINLWPIFKNEWLNSLRGYEAMINCLRFNRLESIITQLPRQRVGIYLIENQPWEMALIHHWRNLGHGKLVGVAHSTVRFWDLRQMSDPRRFLQDQKNLMPRPNVVAVNGPLARNSLVEAKYPESEIFEVEALMYLHLAKSKINKELAEPMTILVATDFLESATNTQIALLNELLIKSPKKYKVFLKPHWSQSFKNLHPDIEIVSGKFDLSTYFELCDVLYCSAITSAVIDGVCAGLPVIQCLDPESFNLSPLRGNSEVKFVRTTQELDDALNHIGASARHISPSVLFNLDLNLSRWHQLLETKAGHTRSNYN